MSHHRKITIINTKLVQNRGGILIKSAKTKREETERYIERISSRKDSNKEVKMNQKKKD
jgi:hypothetical protein